MSLTISLLSQLASHDTNPSFRSIWSTKPKRGTTFVPSKLIKLEPETLPNGQVVERSIEIVPSLKYGYPTVQTQEYWYALQLLWHNSPTKETGRVEFSRREIIEGILGKTYGRQTRRALDLSMDQLATTTFEFRYAFKEKKTGITHSELRKFHIISDLHLTERKKAEDVIHNKCSVTFHPLIVSNLRSGYFKPVILSVITQIKSDIARLLYRKLDLQFSYYSKYEISTKRFFNEHAIVGKKYQVAWGRKQQLEKAVKELVGLPTSSGSVINSYEIVKTKDKKDYKLIVRSCSKNASKQPKNESTKSSTSLKTDTPKIEKSKKTKVKEVSESTQLFTYFDQIFFNNSGVKPSKKEMVEVEKMVTKHGLEKSKFLINYAYERSKNTDYQPKTFMGILRDVSVADKKNLFEAHKKQKATQSRYRVRGEEQKKKFAREEYERTHEPEYFQYILSLKEALTYQYPQDLVEFGKWEEVQRKELIEAVEKASSKNSFFCKKKLEMFDGREGLRAIRFNNYFANHEKIKLPDFWEWAKENNPHR